VSPTNVSESCFSDVKTNLWYHSYICEAVKLGFVKGFSDGTFKPNNPVTVLEALAMSLRLYGLAPESGTPWYTSYQNLADTTKIIDTASYNIHTVMTRGKAADLILRVREYASKKSPLSNLSKGCVSPKSLTSGTHEVTIAGKTRSYILAVPGSYNSSNPAKLIIALHGRTNSNAMVQDYMGLE
jgi:S-layer homology domain